MNSELPVAVVADINVVEHGAVRTVPMIFCSTGGGEVLPVVDAFAYARARSVTHSPASVSSDIRALARLADFIHVALQGRHVEENQQDYLIYAYLATRASGTEVFDRSDRLSELNWKAIGTGTLRREFAAILRYFHFCSTNFGRASLGRTWRMPGGAPIFARMRELSQMRSRDMLAHLSAARMRWHEIRCEGGTVAPFILGRNRVANKIRAFPPSSEIWAIINAERNPTYRAIWLTAAFGGIRISEQLNAWACDVLPEEYRPYFFPEFANLGIKGRVFLRAHPVASTYTGVVGTTSVERRIFLQDRYQLRPRCDLSERDPLRAGWKGTIISGDHHTHQVFWADNLARQMFEECHDEIASFHDIEKTSEKHPYLYVNTSDRAGFRRGEPVKVSAVQSAFERACQRVGLQPRRFGRNLHGMRHYYKWLLRNNLELSEEHVQICLGHASLESQNSYGRSAKSASIALLNKESPISK